MDWRPVAYDAQLPHPFCIKRKKLCKDTPDLVSQGVSAIEHLVALQVRKEHVYYQSDQSALRHYAMIGLHIAACCEARGVCVCVSFVQLFQVESHLIALRMVSGLLMNWSIGPAWAIGAHF